MILATYFDGRTSRAQPVRLAVEAGEAVLFDAEGAPLRRAALSTLRVSVRVKHGPRVITFDDGACCEITAPAVDEITTRSPGRACGSTDSAPFTPA